MRGVSGNTAFTLIERLPTSVTQNTSNPACAGNFAGPNEMYTQIIDEIPISPGVKHRVALRYTRTPTKSFVEYYLPHLRPASLSGNRMVERVRCDGNAGNARRVRTPVRTSARPGDDPSFG